MARRGNHGEAVGRDGKALSDPTERLWADCLEVSGRLEHWWSEGFDLKGIRVRPPADAYSEWLVTITAVREGEPLVAFTTSDELGSALHLALARLMNGSLKWQEDQYAAGKGK